MWFGFYAHKKPGPYPPHPDLAAHNQLEAKSLRNRLDCTLKESTALTGCLKQDWTMCQFLFKAKFMHFRFKDDVKVCLKNFFDFAFAVLTRPYNFWRVLCDWISASFLLYPRFWSLSRKKASCCLKAFWFPWQVRKRRCVSPEIKALKTPSGWQEVLGMYR